MRYTKSIEWNGNEMHKEWNGNEMYKEWNGNEIHQINDI